ncbi:hypothetical protein C0Q70_17999 [Pomacea canaliculata]|uniref:Choline transporter-like protein n=1 Tax=Pomacea canaliculata TaxID=400727 RepID=A0A2T7NLZ9_POMCA|nr:hypothetical protein C0Q70_17999 [Pomacea canaliculata]
MPCCGDGHKVHDVDEKPDSKYGTPRQHNPREKVPCKSRSCTDILCCIIFVIFVLGFVVCAIIGFARGNPIKLVYPTDSYGNVCGDGAYSTKPYLFYFDMLQCAKMGVSVVVNGCPTSQVCVSTCPTRYWSYVQTIAVEAAGGLSKTERELFICKYNVDPQATLSVNTLIDNGDCAAYYVKSTPVINRCIPSVFTDFTNWAVAMTYADNNRTYSIESDNGGNVTASGLSDASYYLAMFYKVREFVELVYKDVVASWWMILVGFGVALVLCLIWIVLMRWIAGIMVWLTIALLFGLIIFGTYYCYNQYYTLKNVNATTEIGVSQAFATNFNYYLSLKQTWLAFGCTLATVLLILVLLFIFLVARICIAVELIKEASRAVGNMFSTLFWPVIPFVLELGMVGLWAVSSVYVASMGRSEYYSNATNVSTDGVNYYLTRIPCDTSVHHSNADLMLFMLLWIVNFFIAIGDMTLAGAFSSYYWAWNKPDDVPAFPVTASLYRSLRYHMGSLAFGSFIIAVVQLVRIILEYIDYKMKGSKNIVATFFMKCLKCCMYCLEKFLKFINKNAYIMIAMRGRNFCFSAKDAFCLIMRNAVRVIVLDKVTDFLLFVNKLIITGAIFVASFFWFRGSIPWFSSYVKVPELNYYLTPVIMLTLGTYFMACLFFSVYAMAVDTLFLCFLEDLEMNDGSPEKPYYMSKGLMVILGRRTGVSRTASDGLDCWEK